MLPMVILAIAVIAAGALRLAFPNFAWGWTRFHTDVGGVASDRTPGWEAGRVISSVALIFVGVVMLLMAYAAQKDHERLQHELHRDWPEQRVE